MRTAILGATGLVGRIMLDLLEERSWVDADPWLLCGDRSAGRTFPFRARELTCRDAAGFSWDEVDLALFSAGGAASLRHGPAACAAGVWVVDNSAAFRMDPEVPLVVPEINGHLVPRLVPGDGGPGGTIANPNCSTIQIALALAPLARYWGLREVQVTTLQAVSGAGRRAVARYEVELQGKEDGEADVFPAPIAGNVIPQIGAALPQGVFEEEAKVERELKKILALPELAVTCTATRVPVLRGHAAAVRAVCSQAVDPAEAADLMAAWPGLEVAADPHRYTTPLSASGSRAVHVGRLRPDPDRGEALLFWVVADNLLKGAAWNAVQIADLLIGDGDPP